MYKAYKYRIYPTDSQKTKIENQFSMCRHLYNWNLKERIEKYKKEQIGVTCKEQQNALPALKAERPWYKSVYSQVLQDVLRRLDKGFLAFFRRVKSGDTTGFPKFKKKGQWNSITYPQFKDVPFDGKINIPKIGKIKIQYHREIPCDRAKIKTLTITKEGGKWFVSFSVDIPFNIEHKHIESSIGLDLGLIYFYKASDGSEVHVPKFFRKSQQRLQNLQRKLSKAAKRSEKYYKLLKSIQKAHFKIKCQRLDFLHKTANEILEKADMIVLENLNIQGMSRRPKPKQNEDGKYLKNGASRKAGLNKSINDAGWYSFLLLLEYKAELLGKTIKKVAPHYTSQKCSSCGAIVKKSLATRTHRCTNCDYVADRDENAAINILNLGLGQESLDPQGA